MHLRRVRGCMDIGQGGKDATSAELQSFVLACMRAGTRADPAADQGQESQGGTTATVGSVSPKTSRGEGSWLAASGEGQECSRQARQGPSARHN